MIKKLFLIIIFSASISFGQSGWWSFFSDESADTTSPTVTSFEAYAISSTENNLIWTSNENVGAIIYRNTNRIDSVPLGTLTYSDAGLQVNTLYTYEIYLFDASGNISDVASDTATTFPNSDITPPATPSDLLATGVSTSQINLTWTNNATAGDAYFRIFRSTSSGGTFTQIDSTVIDAVSYNNTGLPSATAYWYKVSSVDASFNASAQSDADSGLTYTLAGGELETPLNLASTGTDVNTNSLTWDAVASADSYFVYGRSDRYLIYRYQYTLIGKSATNAFTHSNIPDGWEWDYYVKAFSATDTSDASVIKTSFPLRSKGKNRFVTRYGNGGTFDSSRADLTMALDSIVNNMGSLAAGDSVYFIADSVIAPSTITPVALITPVSQVINGDSLAYIVFAKYGEGADPIISANSAAFGKYAMSTNGSLLQYVIFQDLDFYRPIEIRASTGHNHHIQFRRCYINAEGASNGGLWFYTNPTDEPEPWEWTFEGGSRQYNIEIADCYIENSPTDGLNKTGGLFSARGDSILGYGQGDWIHHNQIYDAGEDDCDWQGNGNTIEYNVMNDAIASVLKITPHYNGGAYNIVRGNIVGNDGGAGDLSLSNERHLRCYNNYIHGFNLFGDQEWNPPSGLRSDSNFIFNNIFMGIEYSYTYDSTRYIHLNGDTTWFVDDEIWNPNYFWHNIRGGGSYANMHHWYYSDRRAVWSSGVIVYNYSGGTNTQIQITSANIADEWRVHTPYIKMDTIVTPGLNSTTWDALQTKDTIIARVTPTETGFARNNGYDTTFVDYPFTEDILGNTKTENFIGAVQYSNAPSANYYVTMPDTFTVTYGSDSTANILIGGLHINTDSLIVNFSRGTYPASRFADTLAIRRNSSNRFDSTITRSSKFYTDSVYYWRVWTGADSSGTFVYAQNPRSDTAAYATPFSFPPAGDLVDDDNGTFEVADSSDADFNNYSTNTSGRSTDFGYHGSYSMKFTQVAATGDGFYVMLDNAWLKINQVVGHTYRMSGYAYVASGDFQLRASIDFSLIGAFNAATWTYFEYEYTSDSADQNYLKSANVTNGSVYYLDAVSIVDITP